MHSFLTLLSSHPPLPSLDPREPGYVTVSQHPLPPVPVTTLHSMPLPLPVCLQLAFYLSLVDYRTEPWRRYRTHSRMVHEEISARQEIRLYQDPVNNLGVFFCCHLAFHLFSGNMAFCRFPFPPLANPLVVPFPSRPLYLQDSLAQFSSYLFVFGNLLVSVI
ncbi:uncharacterized protein LY79DRAFT_94711 [Colletotrichum navitas]|uniref:Uncharacterized protein n=1 Tax=Colletotrichum navitas TaxID=681940 RepID=A0AAD8Q598_9PEZI|nr:uncharacterized protein LY79DRAFT_94711 [Colletotrichum navitas]KAK1595854.1 hypothetical protein LY79DRAFT_94711 [Colletotrichum navitas]